MVITRTVWRRTLAVAATAVIATSVAVAAPAAAHPDHGGGGGGQEDFEGEGVLYGFAKQDDGDNGHLSSQQENVTLIGKGEVTNPSGAGNNGRVADVFAYGDYAYLNAFREPTCEAGGVHVMDISDPTAPAEITEAFIPTSPGSYAGEGLQVVPMNNDFFHGDLLVHQNETCGPPTDPTQAGGISLWDVTDPTDPEPILLHTGDFTNPAGTVDVSPNQTHSFRVWKNRFDGHTYVALVDDEEATDVDILDITNPFEPVLINDTLDLVELFAVDQESPVNLTSVFSHDMVVDRIGKRYVMTLNYWDGGYVLLDVTDPNPGQIELIAESDYAELDEERLERGQEISPEGNAHQAELSPNRKFLIGTDEDFNPFRVVATIDSGVFAGTEYEAAQASDVPQVDADTTISGGTTFVGDGCDPALVPPGTGTAVVERGTCSFQIKLDTITAAGYTAGIVVNNVRADCLSSVTMLASGAIPYVFVNRLTGLQLLGVASATAENACTTPAPLPGPASATTIQAIFDGWGYVRLFGTDIPRQRGEAGSIRQIDTYAIDESQDPAFATGFGDLSVHEVAMDPHENLAYLAYYAGGLRVVEYGKKGMEEVGSFIDEGGNNFWGVETWEDEHGEHYILASDRDFGLYIFQYNP